MIGGAITSMENKIASRLMIWPTKLRIAFFGNTMLGMKSPVSLMIRLILDQAALEFRQCTKHVKNQPALCDRGVERLGEHTTRGGSD
jgi:hypothetical protein